MKGVFITLCAVVALTLGTIFYCYKSHEVKVIEYKNELQTAIEQTKGTDWDVIEVRGVQMTVKDAQGIIDYINLNY